MCVEMPSENVVDEFIPTRESLLSRLRDCEDQRSWQTFFDTYRRLIYTVALRAGLNDTEAQEVVQETFISLAKSLPGFHYDPQKGSFKSWLMRLTRWRIQNQMAKRLPASRFLAPEAQTATGTSVLERVADPATLPLETTWDEEWEANLMEAALNRVKARVDPKQFQIFDYRVLKQLPVERVVKALGVSRGRVYLARHRIAKLVKAEVTRLRATALWPGL